MTRRRHFALPIVALIATATLFAGACSSDSKADKKETTTTTKSKSDSGDSTSTTVSAEDFDKTIAAANKALKDANGDPCKVISAITAMGSAMSDAKTTDQRKQATGVAVAAIHALADAAPANLKTEADQLNQAADAIAKEGKETNYSDDFMKEPKAISAESGYNDAMTAISSDFMTKCGGATGSGNGGAGSSEPSTTEAK